MQIAQNWRLNEQRYKLMGEECPISGDKIFPPRDVFPSSTDSSAKELFALTGIGEVFSYTTVYHPPAGYEFNAPYIVALIKLEQGPVLTAQLTDVEPEDVSIGMPVEAVTRKLRENGEEGMIVYGYKFRPI